MDYEKNSFINLTPKGLKHAKAILGRHEILISFFRDGLGLEGEHAEDQACRVEHAIDQETARRIKILTEYVKESANSGDANSWRTRFEE